MNGRSRWHLPSSCGLLPAVLCAIGLLCALPAAADVHSASAHQAPAPATGAAAPAGKRVPHSQREELYFARRYDIGQLRVRSSPEGASLEFRCQVLDAEKAKALNDNRFAPVAIERKSGNMVDLVIGTVHISGLIVQ
jgi:hypothetical protein